MIYHKIQGLYKRDMDKESLNYGKFIIGKYSLPEFEMLKDIQWTWTEKIDGTNIRCILSHFLNKNNDIDFQREFKGKTDKAEMPNHLLVKLQETIKKDKLVEIFNPEEIFEDICLYGGGYGYKIQNGGKYFINPNDVGFVLFDIRIGNTWLTRKSIEEIAEKLRINVVPLIGKGTIDEAIEYIKSEPKSRFGFKNFTMEGLVIKPEYELLDRRGHRIITKIKRKDFK